MRLPVVCILGFALALALIGAFARAPAARTEGILEACSRDEREIEAAALPSVVQPGECPIEGRPIVDGPVGSLVPAPGEGVYAEVLTVSGAQELEVRRRADGALELDHAGDDSVGGPDAARSALPTGGQDPCSDRAYTDLSYKVASKLRYRFGASTTPGELSRSAAEDAIRKAAVNVFSTTNDCRRLGDRVPVAVKYDGRTSARAHVGNDLCGRDDGRSVVSFGSLRPGVLAATCALFEGGTSYGEVTSSDIKINKVDFRWTVKPNSGSCSRRFDLQSVMTHEWGHTFGLGHVSERDHGWLTMSGGVNGPCQASERTLGRGDVLGLDGKYP
jgi:hypothetical protein